MQDGSTPLHSAIWRSYNESEAFDKIVKMLVKKGAKLEAKDLVGTHTGANLIALDTPQHLIQADSAKLTPSLSAN